EQSSFMPALTRAFEMKKPMLGICVGFQMLFERSEEGNKPGLGWVRGEVVRFDTTRLTAKQKIPHMGWSDVSAAKDCILFKKMENPRFYFVHSFHPQPKNAAETVGICDYGYAFCCAVKKDNLIGVQFHPEKSHRFGMQLLKNFSTEAL